MPVPSTLDPTGPDAAPDPRTIDRWLEILDAGDVPSVRLRDGVTALPDLVPGCHHASASLVTYAGSRLGASSDPTAWQADVLQDTLDEGPALQALRTGHSVIVHDLDAGGRWPLWAAGAAQLGLGSALVVLLCAGRRPIGTLSLYADGPGALSDVDLALLRAVSMPLTRALAAVRLEGLVSSPG